MLRRQPGNRATIAHRHGPPFAHTVGGPWDRITVTAVAGHSVAFMAGEREYQAAMIVPRHSCPEAPALAVGEALDIAHRGANGDVLAAAPCGCHYLLYNVARLIRVESV
jgi:hypothetical protein